MFASIRDWIAGRTHTKTKQDKPVLDRKKPIDTVYKLGEDVKQHTELLHFPIPIIEPLPTESKKPKRIVKKKKSAESKDVASVRKPKAKKIIEDEYVKTTI